MKKYLFLAVAATALFASCSNDEVVEMNPQNAIGFSTFVDKSTRATDATKANLGEISVYGWIDDDLLFDAQAVTSSNQGETWTYAPTKYWAPSSTYNFEAIAPAASDNNGVSFIAAKTGGTFNFDNSKAGAAIDLLYSKATEVSTGEEIIQQPDDVAFTFNHMLSKVTFTFINGFATGSSPVLTVSDVTITDAYTSGSLVCGATVGNWNDLTSKELNVIFGATTPATITTIANETKGITTPMYLIPNETTEVTYTVTFTVEMKQGENTEVYEHVVTIPAMTMAKGNSYNFVAELNAETVNPESQMFPITFTVQKVEEFTSQDDTYIVGDAD